MADIRLFPLPGATRRDPAIERWMSSQPEQLQSLARHWLEEIRSAGPEVFELLHDGHPTACVGNLAFAYVDAFRAHVNIGFFLGTALDDPARLLQGSGRFMRHVKVRPNEPLNESALKKLIRAAFGDMKARADVQ